MERDATVSITIARTSTAGLPEDGWCPARSVAAVQSGAVQVDTRHQLVLNKSTTWPLLANQSAGPWFEMHKSLRGQSMYKNQCVCKLLLEWLGHGLQPYENGLKIKERVEIPYAAQSSPATNQNSHETVQISI